MNPSSASYLGKGHFLTAAHNLYASRFGAENADLIVQDLEGHFLLDVSSKDYEIFLPPGHTYMEFLNQFGQRVKIPFPDVMLIRVKQQHLEKLKGLTQVLLPTEALDFAKEHTIAGRASDWKLGSVSLNQLDAHSRYLSTARPQENEDHPMHGDSGGPLFRKFERGYVQYGVITSIKKDANGDVVSSYFSLVESGLIDWIKKKVGQGN